MLLDLIRFVLFVVSAIALATGAQRLLSRELTEPHMTWGRWFIQGQVAVFIAVSSFFVIFLLLAGYFNLPLLLLLFVGYEIATLVPGMLFWFTGSGPSDWAARNFAFMTAFMSTHPSVKWLLAIYQIVFALGYFVVAGVVYFSFSGYELTVHVLQFISISTLLNYPPLLLGALILLPTPAVDEKMRDVVLVGTLRLMFPAGISLAIAFWAFRVAPGASAEEVGRGLPLQLSPLVFAVLTSLFLIGVVAPYGIGVHRGRQFRVRLHKEEKEHVKQVYDVLRVPSSVANTALLSAQLEELSEKFLGNLIDDTKRSIGVPIDSQFDTLLKEAIEDPDTLASSDLPPDIMEKVKQVVIADEDPDDLDPLFRHCRWLKELATQVREAREDLEKRERENSLQSEDQRSDKQFELWQRSEAWRQQWLYTFEDQSERLDTSIETEQNAKRPILVAASAVASTGMGFFIEKVGGWAWIIFQSSQGR
jgi:hypothetical protein